MLPAGSLRRHLRTVAVRWSEGASGALTIALLKAKDAADAHGKTRRDEAFRGTGGGENERGSGRQVSGVKSPGLSVREAGANVGVDAADA